MMGTSDGLFSPLGVVHMVSPLWVVNMDSKPLEDCEQRLPLGGCRHCLSLECCRNGLLPDTISHGQYTPDIVWMGGGGLEIKAHHP